MVGTKLRSIISKLGEGITGGSLDYLAPTDYLQRQIALVLVSILTRLTRHKTTHFRFVIPLLILVYKCLE